MTSQQRQRGFYEVPGIRNVDWPVLWFAFIGGSLGSEVLIIGIAMKKGLLSQEGRKLRNVVTDTQFKLTEFCGCRRRKEIH